MPKPKKDCSADFHRAKRKEREKDTQKSADLKPVPDKIPEGPDHAKKRSDYFKKRREKFQP